MIDYALQDFLLFSADVYTRLVYGYQDKHQWLAIVINSGLLLAMFYSGKRRALCSLVWGTAILWAWVGWRFYLAEYASINGFAIYLGGACFVQSSLMILCSHRLTNAGVQISLVPLLLMTLYLVCLRPFIASLTGMPLVVSPIGLMPMATILFSLALLVSLKHPQRAMPHWLLLPIPIALGIIECLTQLVLNSGMWQEFPVLVAIVWVLHRSIDIRRFKVVRGLMGKSRLHRF